MSDNAIAMPHDVTTYFKKYKLFFKNGKSAASWQTRIYKYPIEANF